MTFCPYKKLLSVDFLTKFQKFDLQFWPVKSHFQDSDSKEILCKTTFQTTFVFRRKAETDSKGLKITIYETGQTQTLLIAVPTIYIISKLHSTITSSLLGVTGRSNYRNEHKNKLFHIIQSKISFCKVSNLGLRVTESARILLVPNTSKPHF